MALRDCQECGKSISTSATICPHCGCPLHKGRKRRSYLGPLLLILLILVVWNAIVSEQSPRRTLSEANTVEGPRCDATKADALLGKFMSAGVLSKLESNRSVPRIYVLEAWHHLTIDDKKTLDNAIQCHLMRGVGQPVLAVYHDGRTGKEIAETGPYGFSVK